MAIFSEQEYLRYSRHIQLPNFGAAGQTELKKSRVVIVGCGGLGAPVSLYLAAAGVGHITLIDGDRVALSNLQRQIIFTEEDIGQPKVRCAKTRLHALNSSILIDAIDEPLCSNNAIDIVTSADLVLDCTDNFEARYLINDTCRSTGTPWVYASVYQYSGQCAVFTPATSCFRCLYPHRPENTLDCNAAGVLGVIPGLLGTIQANEAIKLLRKQPTELAGRLRMIEAEDLSTHTIELQTNAHCPACASDFVFDPEQFSGITKTNTATTPQPRSDDTQSGLSVAIGNTIVGADFYQYAARDDVLVIDVRSAAERAAFDLGGRHIPLDTLASTGSLPMEKTLLVYCQSGDRSATACAALNKRGFSATSLHGGIVSVLRQSQEENEGNDTPLR